MAKVLPFTGITKLDIAPDDILGAANGQLASCLLIGYDHEGDLYVASSSGDRADSLWLLECCKKLIMEDVEFDTVD